MQIVTSFFRVPDLPPDAPPPSIYWHTNRLRELLKSWGVKHFDLNSLVVHISFQGELMVCGNYYGRDFSGEHYIRINYSLLSPGEEHELQLTIVHELRHLWHNLILKNDAYYWKNLKWEDEELELFGADFNAHAARRGQKDLEEEDCRKIESQYIGLPLLTINLPTEGEQLLLHFKKPEQLKLVL